MADDLTYGSICAGVDGLSMGVQSVLGGTTSWVAEYDPEPSRVLAHNSPGVPNLGDITKVDWTKVEPVDVLDGGTPCQDLSNAGSRAGMTEGTRSNLWVQMREAIHAIRPRLVVWENVRGAYSAHADSGVEWCPGCMGGPRDGRTSLRALGRVLGDLSDLGYDAGWYGLPATDVDACHKRFRTGGGSDPVFVYGTRAADPHDPRLEEHGRLHPAPREGQADAHRRGAPDDLTLLPTPAVNDMGDGKTLDWWDEWAPRQVSAAGRPAPHGRSLAIEALRLLKTPTSQLAVNGGSQHPNKRKAGGHGPTLADEVEHLLPTPRATDGTNGGPNQRGSSGDLMLPSAVHQDWAAYTTAIARHAAATGRPAPPPTQPGTKGGANLSPRFVEWLMMLPDGHVTNPVIWEGVKPATARNAQLRILGNGVVPPRWLHDRALT